MKHLPFLNSILKIFISKNGIIFFNIIIFAVSVFSIMNIVSMYFNTADDSAKVDHILNAIATMFVAYGVALEERESIQKILNSEQLENDEELNHVSHNYGVVFLVLALFVEVTTEIIKIPNSLLNLNKMEPLMSGTGIILTLILIIELAVYTIKMAHIKNQSVKTV